MSQRKRTCAGCGGPYTSGKKAYLLRGKTLRAGIVCRTCAGAAVLLLIAPLKFAPKGRAS